MNNGLKRESTYFSDKMDDLGGAVLAGTDSAGLWVGKKAAGLSWWGAKKAGQAGLGASSLVGKAAIGTTSRLGSWTIHSLSSANPLKNPIGVATKAAYKLGGSMVNYTPSRKVYNTTRDKIITKAPSLKLSKIGAGAILGGSILASAASSLNKFETDRLGTVDTQTTTTNPDYTPQEYTRNVEPPDDAGATGDLVFALFKNRRGGSLL